MARTTKSHEQNVGAEDFNDVVRIVAQRLQDARQSAGLTQSQLGEKAGVKQSYVFELEYGDTNPTLRTLEKMAKALDINLHDLLPGPPGAPASASDVKHLTAKLDRATSVVEEYLLNERHRIEREETRREKQETALREALREMAKIRFNLPPLDDLIENGQVPESE
ncbi:hypothetical protein GCM10010909_12540 [Acidocella aquatica]|uniref:HTH cro/C1-type domain-containing protein n=1 Tax=Acidocella aquatica TaxID=1922313 RepID=A0ABQ6A326_9PROT|nr:helix-turn-helix transcriptional regulator [Acidocella aquatica]GLR66574.1 hypothetical protein GCM10010909_12540 [Acidocella aquatica]